jgi:signal transduction histidine kinase
MLTVMDDGAGGATAAAGRGLAGLADRVAALGGTLTVDSAPGHGTRIQAALPCV